MYIDQWLLLIGKISLVCFILLGLCYVLIKIDEDSKLAVYSTICCGFLFLVIVALFYVGGEYAVLYGKWSYVGNILSENYMTENYKGIGKGYVSEVDNRYLSNVELILDNNNPYDKVYFEAKDKELSIKEFIKGIKDKSVWLDVRVEETTDFILVKGSDICIVSDISKHIGVRGEFYYSEEPYIRYKDKLFCISHIRKIELNDEATYIIMYDGTLRDTIVDLSGEHTCFVSCSLLTYPE